MHPRHEYSKKSSFNIIVCLLFSATLFMAGCADDTPNQGSETVTTSTFHDPQLAVTGLVTEGAGGMFSWFLDLIGEGLKEGITVWIGEKTTGRVLDIIANKIMGGGDDDAAALKTMNNNMLQMEKQLDGIKTQITELAEQLSIDVVILQNYITSSGLSPYITTITTRWDTGDDGYMYFSRNGAALAEMDKTDPTYAAKAANLKADADSYYAENKNSLDIKTAIQGIHDSILPTLTKGVLIDYTNKIILTNQFNGSDSDKATQCYNLLESFFSQLLATQTQAYIMIMEVDNYRSSLSNGGDYAKDYRIFYAKLMNEEVEAFKLAVNHLMLNLIDFRTTETYQQDAKYIHTQGLARDNVYNHLFARSRFFSRQVMKNFDDVLGTHPLPDNIGLHGTIVTPAFSSPSEDSPVTQISLKFSGPTTFTKVVNASTSSATSRFPYTKWDVKNRTSEPDYNWSFYDIDFSSDDLPAGKYTITLVDHGKIDVPWYHTTTDLGTVSIKYYDPKTADATKATTTPTATNTVKFGSFSGRWNWGYTLFSLSPMTKWFVPAKTTFIEYNTYGRVFTTTSNNPYLFPDDESFSGSCSYYPHHGSSIEAVHNLGWELKPHLFYADSANYTAYEIQTPFTVGNFADSAADIFYDVSGNVVFNASEDRDHFGERTRTHVYYDFILNDGSTKNTIYGYSSSSRLRSINEPIAGSGKQSGKLEAGKDYSLGIDSGWNSYTYHLNTQSGKVDLDWNMQVVYTHTRDLAQM